MLKGQAMHLYIIFTVFTKLNLLKVWKARTHLKYISNMLFLLVGSCVCGGQQSTLLSSSIMFHHHLRQNLSPNLDLVAPADLANQWTAVSASHPKWQYYRHAPLCLAFRQVLGIRLMTFGLCKNHLTNLTDDSGGQPDYFWNQLGDKPLGILEKGFLDQIM